MKIFITADHHFHHKNIIEYCKRPFKTVEEIRKKIFEIKNWADKNIQLKEHARVWLEKNGDDYRLIISGRGSDERCTWCRSFRTALNKGLFDLKVAVYQNGFCKFDEKSGYRKVRKIKGLEW